MPQLQLYCLTDEGPQALPVPPGAGDVHALFENLPVGVYTVFRTYDHDRFLHLGDHLGRLEQSMARLGWNYRLDRGRLRRALQEVCRRFPGSDARVRLDILDPMAGPIAPPARELIGLAPFTPVPETLYESGVSVAIAKQLVRNDPLVKHSAFVAERRRLRKVPGVYELLLVDGRERILEGASSNFYGFRDGALITAAEGVLTGVARRVVLHVAAVLKIPVTFRPVSVDEISTLDEAALSSSSRAIVPIVQIDGCPVGDGRPGPLVRRLLAGYRDHVRRHIRPAA